MRRQPETVGAAFVYLGGSICGSAGPDAARRRGQHPVR